MGVCGVCVGCSGLESLVDLRGTLDRNGRPLQVTQIAVADQLCATATLVCGEAAEGRPIVIVRGVPREYLRDEPRRTRAGAAARAGSVSVSTCPMKYLALSGGVGGAKLVVGLAQVLPADSLTSP